MAKGKARGWRDPEKERRWRQVVQEWRRSGLSVRDFCEWQALSEPSFYAWRRELARRDAEVRAGRSPRAGRSSHTNRGPQAAGTGGAANHTFVPVRVLADGPVQGASAPSLEVHLPSGVRLCVPAGVPRQTLADVLAALEARAC